MGIANGIAGRGAADQLAAAAVAAQTPAAATRTYLTGSQIVLTGNATLKAGMVFRWSFYMTKTAAGTATSTIDVAFGTAGTTADTARLSFTKPAGTAAVDEGKVTVEVIIRSVSASGVAVGEMEVTHNGNTAGHMTIPVAVVNAVSAGFDMTTVTSVGLCLTSGASDAITVSGVTAEILIPS